MDNKRSCCCGAFPKGLWWLLTLLGLPLLYFLMFNANKDPIEADLTQRVTETLSAENMAWAKVSVDERGRDVFLSGQAPSVEAKDKAVALAQSVTGVRVAEGEFTDFVAVEDMVLNIDLEDGKVVLNGSVGSQAEIDAIVKAAVGRVGEGNVVNNLTINKQVKLADWLGALPGLMGLAVSGGSLSASAKGIKYTGTVESQDIQDTLLGKAKKLLASFNVPVINGLTIKAPEPVATENMVLNVDLKDGKIILNGSVGSQAEMDAIVKAAEGHDGAGDVVNNLTINKQVKSAGWLGALSGLMGLTVEDGSLSASADGVKYTGTVQSQDIQDTLLGKAKELLASFNIPVINGLEVKEPIPVADPVVEVKKEAINVCQNKLNDAMAGKSIHFRTNAATIQLKSHDLLNQIASVMAECNDEISAGVSINGHTDSRGDDAYNMALSLRRAEAVKKYLEERNVGSSLMKSVGHGETSPIASNDTREGMAENRRITFIINQ